MAITLIQTQTASGSSQLDFTTGISGTYNNYMIIVNQLRNVQNDFAYLVAQISTNGGSSYISSNYKDLFNSSNIGLGITGLQETDSTTSSTTYIYNLTSGSGYIMTSSYGAIFGNPNISADANNAMYTTANTSANALRIKMSDSTNFSATVSLYSITT